MSEQNILLISGCKQSGKSSAMNYLTGFLLQRSGLIKEFKLDEGGNLLIDTEVLDPTTNTVVKEWGLLDVTRQDPEYVRDASRKIWPIVKAYHFADTLKEVCVAVFGLDRSEIYGTDDDKNKPSKVRWVDMGKLITLPKRTKDNPRPEFMTNREFMEYFGTNVCRSLNNLCWIESCFKRVIGDGYPLSIIPDCRFPDEVEYAQNIGAKVIRLTRQPHEGTHPAETSLLTYDKFDKVIDNTDMTQEEKGIELVKWLQEIGWI